MQDFGHVDSEFLRGYLTAPLESLSQDDHIQALFETQDACEADIRADETGIDTGLPDGTIAARESACDTATAKMLQGFPAAARDAMRLYWSV